MKTVSLALVGDIHYPDYKTGQSFVDQKDTGVTPRIVNRIAPNPLKMVSEALRNEISSDKSIRAVLLCGDLTSRGDMGAYAECIAYLEKILDLPNTSLWNDKQLHVVPGNHDISRNSVDTTDDNIFKKFDDIKNAWISRGRTEMQPDTVRTTDAESGNGGVARIFSVNSCVGCGEHRFLSPALKAALEKVLSQHVSGTAPVDPFELIKEQLDTPAIDDEHLNTIERSMSQLEPQTGVPILLAHHGLLPQAIPRVQIYSELLNSGRVRFLLANHKRPVIYCHGHLHEDPIEIVSHPQGGAGKIIVISAPLFVDGFNVIRIEFNNDGVPMGCEVSRHRLENGSVAEKESARISLLTYPPTIEGASTLRYALDSTTPIFQRFKTIHTMVNTKAGSQVDDGELADVLIELEWMGLVEIGNRKNDTRHWHVKRVAP